MTQSDHRAPLRLALSLPELAQALGLDRATVYRKLASGEIDIPTIRIGSSVRVRVVDVEDYLERLALEARMPGQKQTPASNGIHAGVAASSRRDRGSAQS